MAFMNNITLKTRIERERNKEKEKEAFQNVEFFFTKRQQANKKGEIV